MGLYTICFAWPKGSVCAEIADQYFPISVTEKEIILDICYRNRIDGICTIASDIAAPTVAYIAEKLGLHGNQFEASNRATDKYLMREAFFQAGIRCPGFKRICSVEEAKIQNWSYPVIIKPCDRSGSLGVRKVTNQEDLTVGVQEALNYSFKHEAIIEDYIEGREVSVEFISYQGIHYPLTITDKVTTGAPHFVELEHHQPAELSTEIYDRLYMTTRKALNALGITDGASHTEYRIRNNGDIFIIELGARMGGDFIGSDLVRLSTGYDFVKGVIQVALGEFTVPLFSNSLFSGVFFLCKETARLLPFFESSETNKHIIKMERTSSELKEVSCSGDRSGYLLYQADKRIVL